MCVAAYIKISHMYDIYINYFISGAAPHGSGNGRRRASTTESAGGAGMAGGGEGK